MFSETKSQRNGNIKIMLPSFEGTNSKHVGAEMLGKDLSSGAKSHEAYKGMIDLMSQKEKLRAEKEQHEK
jgi:hypothetical protein